MDSTTVELIEGILGGETIQIGPEGGWISFSQWKDASMLKFIGTCVLIGAACISRTVVVICLCML
jgi:hypothetical protein